LIEIVVLSGKGGTGKTSLTAAFAHLSSQRVLCDLDVDAPDLHLILQPEVDHREVFISGNEARIVTEKCENCGICADLCRFGAVVGTDGSSPRIDPIRCEGCGVCVDFCPAGAIEFPEKRCGEWYRSQTRFGAMIHAQLDAGEENSGRLVALLRQQARRLAETRGAAWILSDGPPGIGCPVISSLSGASLALIVTEPTPSGRHDLQRMLDLCAHFQVPAGVIINKADVNSSLAETIKSECTAAGLTLLGELPHDPVITRAMVKGLAVTEYDNGAFSEQLRGIWREIQSRAGLRRQPEAVGKNPGVWPSVE